MESNRPNLLKFVVRTHPETPQASIVNRDGSTVYVYDAKLIRLLSEAFRAQYEVLTPPDDTLGTRQPDGNWSGVVGMILRSEADLAMGGLYITEERFQAVNFTFPHTLNRVTFMTDKPQPVSKNMAIFHPFESEVWISISLFLVAIALVFYLFMKRKTPLQRVVLIVFGSILEQGLDFDSKTNALRLLTAVWLVGFMILSYSYKAVLLSFLSFPTLSGIRDISELAKASTDRSFRCLTFKGSSLLGYFLESPDAGLKSIGECLERNRVETGTALEAFPTAGPKKAFVISSNFMASWENDYFISEDSFTIAMGGIPFSSRFCCPDRLNSISLRLVASGVLNKITGDDDFLAHLQRGSVESGVDETAVKINLDDISGAFYILMSGWLLSFIVFLAEILFPRYSFQTK